MNLALNITQTNSGLQQGIRNLERFIGNTPLFPLSRLVANKRVRLYAKLEWQQLGGSVKARPAFNIIKQAVQTGALHRNKTLIDASSGNTAIAYASIGASLGFRVKLFIPDNASDSRKQILKNLGAELVFTSPFGSTDEAQQDAQQAYESDPEQYFYANQYANDNNWKAHYEGTAVEILKQTDHNLSHFVAGLGTTGTFTGVSKRLKEFNPDIQVVELQPDTVLHGLEGWKHLETAIVPAIYQPKMADKRLSIPTQEAYALIKTVAQKEGLLISPSAAANLAGALQIANTLEKGTVVTVFPDNAEKYSEVLHNIFNN